MELKFTHMTEDNEPVLLDDDKLLLSENNDDDLIIVENNRKNHEGADYSSYQLPGVDLLMPQDDNDYDYTEEIQKRSTEILNVLSSFGVEASLGDVDRGPRITRYHIIPAKGVKVTRILSLENDIALSLAVQSVRIETPIPGKSAIGIHIPNDHQSLVHLSELIDTDEFRNKKQKTTICLGKDVTGTPVFSDIESLPHLIIAGATGMGKSICIDSFISSMLYKATPDELKFILIDPKMVEFNKYNGIPHLLVPVITDIKHAAGALSWALEEMHRRYDLIKKAQVSNITEYNDIVKNNTSLGEPLPRIVIIIDEFADLMMTARRHVEHLIQSLAQKARAAGIHLIISTQRPDVSVIPGTIKANIPARISFRVPSATDSRTIIDVTGAQTLLPRGDMLYTSGSLNLTRIQGAYVSDEEIKRILSFIKNQTQGTSYNEDIMNDILCEAQKIDSKYFSDDDVSISYSNRSENYRPLEDEQFLEAVDIALTKGQISTALLQRRLGIGFAKAARYIDCMEDIGIVSEKNGAKPRNVLITHDEWADRFARINIDETNVDKDTSDIKHNEISKLPEEVDLDDFDDTEDSFGKKNRTLKDTAKRIIHIMDTSDENGDSTSPSYETVASMLKIVDIGTSIDVDKFMEAINYAICGGSVSTSMIQRKMGIGFGQAIKFIDLMEEMGIISKRNGAMPREVLMTKKEWRDVLEKLKNE